MAQAHLNLEERIELEAALRAGETQAAIRLARAAGTISRKWRSAGLVATAPPRRTVRRRAGVERRDGDDCALEEHPPLRAADHERLHRGWSPEEIAGSLKRDYA